MAEFVKKTMMGYKEVPGGASDPECTHVILKEKEYEQQLRKISVAEQEARNAKYDADQEIRQVRSDAQSRVSAAVAEADQRVKALEQELAMAQKEAKHQRGLNANLLRISKERANADRKLKPKKEHSIATGTEGSGKGLSYGKRYCKAHMRWILQRNRRGSRLRESCFPKGRIG